jgi:RND family efflux transporter MFP subunit
MTTKTLRAVVAGTVLFWSACQPAPAPGEVAGADPKQAPHAGATRVEAATVRPAAVSIELVRPGEVDPAREADLAAALGGYIESVLVQTGDTVERGALVAKVDSTLHGANRRLAQVEVDDARRELSRLRGMGASVAKVRVDAAQTRLDRAEAQLKVAQIQSSRTVIKAPFAGTVADVSAEQGEVAPPGAVLARLVQTDPAVVSVAVTDRDVAALQVGGVASIVAGGEATPLEGRIARIDPTADPQTRSFRVEVELPNPTQRLRPGMIATVEFRNTTAGEQIVVPQELIVTRSEENGVFVVDAGSVARWRPLQLGAFIRDQVVVEGGLAAGDVIVVLGHRLLAEGDPLLVGRLGECCVAGRVVFPTAAQGRVAAAGSSGVGG